MGSSRTGSNTGRARRALAAMKALGFPKKQILAVLKRLIKLYVDENKWELIEAENYRVLADAILDAQANGNGDQEQEQGTEQEEIDDIPAEYGDPSISLAGGPPSPPSPIAEQYAATTELAISPGPQARALTRTLGKRRHRQMMDAVLQEDDAVFLRDPKPEPVDMDASRCRNVQPGLISRSRRHTDSEEMFGGSPPLQPDQNPKQIPGARNRTIRHCRNGETTTLPESTSSTLNNGTEPVVQNVQEAPCLDIGVASSAMGEVKMSLKCSVDPSKFRMPALEAVFKMVEDKCLHSYKVLPPDFSVGSLMTEMCQCVVQLGTEHTVDHNKLSDGAGNGSRSEDGTNRKQKAAEELLVSNGSERSPVNSTLAQQQHLALPMRRTNHDVTDISKGEEKRNIRRCFVNLARLRGLEIKLHQRLAGGTLLGNLSRSAGANVAVTCNAVTVWFNVASHAIYRFSSPEKGRVGGSAHLKNYRKELLFVNMLARYLQIQNYKKGLLKTCRMTGLCIRYFWTLVGVLKGCRRMK